MGMAVGLYYYHIDEGVKGGEIELSSLIALNEDETSVPSKAIGIDVVEGTSLVFHNALCYHRVRELHGTGSRKIISFFLLHPDAPNRIDASNVVVNWDRRARDFVESCFIEMEEYEHSWLIGLVLEYVVGDREYIAKAADQHEKCRLAFSNHRPSRISNSRSFSDDN